MTDDTPDHITTTARGTDHSPFITDAATEDASIGQGHTTNLNMAEPQATTGDMYLTPHSIITSAYDTHSPKDTIGNILTGTHHTDTARTHPQHAILHARAAPDYFIDESQSSLRHSYNISHRSCTHKASKSHSQKAIPIDPSIRRRSPLRTHTQTLPQNQTMALIC